MSDLTDLGYLAVVCLGIILLFHLRGMLINTITGRAAAARHVILTIVLGIYLFKHAIAVLGVAFIVLGYVAITTETTVQQEDRKKTTTTKPKPTTRIRGIANKVVTQKTTVKK